jgi:hypothetical protein
MPLKRRKKPEQGLQMIVALGAIQCLSAVMLGFRIEDWSPLEIRLGYFAILYFACFGLRRLAQGGKYTGLGSGLFREFTASKGLVAVMVGPAILFWIQLARNYHEALPIMGPFTGLAIIHLLALVIILIIAAITGLKTLAAGNKPAKKRITKPLFDVRDLIANVLYLRFLYRALNVDFLGKFLFVVVPGAYMAFVVLSLVSLAIPDSAAAVTSGSLQSAQTVDYVIGSRSGSHEGQYCVFDVDASGRTERFATFQCPACPSGANVTVRHNPIDYLNRHDTTATCESAPP